MIREQQWFRQWVSRTMRDIIICYLGLTLGRELRQRDESPSLVGRMTWRGPRFDETNSIYGGSRCYEKPQKEKWSRGHRHAGRHAVHWNSCNGPEI